MIRKLALYCSGAALLAPSLGWAAGDTDMDALMAMDLGQLRNVKVSVASKSEEKISEAPGVIDVITDKDIALYGDRTLGDVLNHLPSFHVLGTYVAQQNYASIRGESLTHYDNHTLVLMNGRPIRDSIVGSMGTNIYRTFPVEAIKRVEVIRGPGSALYGTNAFAGVINIVTKTVDDQPEYRTDVTYGSNNHREGFVSKGVQEKEAKIFAAGRLAKDDGWDRGYTDETGAFLNDDVKSGDYSGIANLEYKNFTLNTFASMISENDIGIVPIGTGADGKKHHNLVDAGYKLDVNEDLYVNTNITYNHFKWYANAVNSPMVQSNDYLGEATAHYQLLDNLKLVAGQTMEYRDGNVTGLDYNNHWYSTYAQAEFKPVEQVKLVAGGQYNKIEGADGSYVPRFGAIYNYNEHLGAKLLYGQAFRGAAALETNVSVPILVGNPALTPEEIATYDAQVFYNTDEYNASVTYFRSKLTDIISRTTTATPGLFTYTNGGEVKTQGIELEGKWNLTSRWSVQGNATFQENEGAGGVHNATADANTMLKGGVTYNTQQGVVVSVFDSYFGEAAAYPAAAQVNPPADSYNLVSATVNMDLFTMFGNGFNGMEVALHGENLLDEDVYYPEYIRQRIDTLPQTEGRLLYGTFSLKF